MKKKSCPKCERISEFDPYFNAYICRHCGWESDRTNERYMLKRFKNGGSFKKIEKVVSV